MSSNVIIHGTAYLLVGRAESKHSSWKGHENAEDVLCVSMLITTVQRFLNTVN